MSSQPQIDTGLFDALAHPVRIEILKILSQVPKKFTELKKMVHINSSGQLTHHLGKMETLIDCSQQGLYNLTDKGRSALFLVDVVNRENKIALIRTYLLLGASVFYGIGMTIIWFLEGSMKWLWWVNFLGAWGFYFVIWLILRTKIHREEWRFLWFTNSFRIRKNK